MPRRLRARRVVLLLVVPAILVIAAGAVWPRGGCSVDTDNAHVNADKVPVNAEVAREIAEVLVRENLTVAAGHLLFRLDAAPFRVAVAKAQARVAQLRTDVDALRAGYREMDAESAVSRKRQGFALKDQQRQAKRVARGFVCDSRFDDAWHRRPAAV